ncbi:MAG: hypothetical protein LAO03_00760 [Acidobacteriia bacterium]|nr:hypothetical protein [Terriglobia bacterium]
MSSIEIAWVERKLRQMREDEPHFLQRIADLEPDQQTLAKDQFAKAIAGRESELRTLTTKNPQPSA